MHSIRSSADNSFFNTYVELIYFILYLNHSFNFLSTSKNFHIVFHAFSSMSYNKFKYALERERPAVFFFFLNTNTPFKSLISGLFVQLSRRFQIFRLNLTPRSNKILTHVLSGGAENACFLPPKRRSTVITVKKKYVQKHTVEVKKEKRMFRTNFKWNSGSCDEHAYIQTDGKKRQLQSSCWYNYFCL